MVASDSVHAAGYGQEYVADLGGLGNRHHLVAVHRGFERAYGVYLGDDGVSAHSARPERDSAPAPAISADDDLLACPEDVSGAGDAVQGALSGAVSVVEEVLCVCVVDRDDRVVELALLGEAVEPYYAGGSLLSAADHLG